MYSKFQLIVKYLKYYLGSSNGRGHGIHSPFIFEFITKVLNDKSVYPEYEIAESLRKNLLADHTVLNVEDMGAGSSVAAGKQREVGSIAKNAAKTKKYGQLLFRMAQYYQPRHMLELGTSVGITASYLSLANPSANLVTLEGAPAIASFAINNFDKLGLKNITVVKGNFDDTLSPSLEKIQSVDLAFIDGNHRLEPTLRYFDQLLAKTHNESILVVDDIHWSAEMERAWDTIRIHPSVRCTIDLFFIGIVVFRREFHEKQHFTIRF